MIGSAVSIVRTGVETEFSILMLTVALPSLPSLVVTRITPFAPRAPYNAVAVASFIMEKLAMSSTFRRARSAVVSSTLSIRMRGLAAYPNVVTPRMKKLASSFPGSPLV